MHADTKLFRTFLAVAQSGSMREASDILHLAQSAISRQIVSLEEELGVPLFDRLPRGVSLTSAGEIFFKHAKESLQRAEKIRNDIAALKGHRSGLIRVMTAETFTSGLLPRTIARFQSRFGAVQFDVRVATTSALIERLVAGDAEFGIAYNAPANLALGRVALANTQMAALMRPDHPLANATTALGLADIGPYPVALPAEYSASRILLDTTAERLGIRLFSSIESDSVQLRLNIAMNSDTIVLVGLVAAMRWLDDGSLVARKLRDRPLNHGRVELLTLKGRQLPVAAQAFGTALQAEFDASPILSV